MAFKISEGVLKKYTEEPGVTDVVIPEGVTSIGDRAFFGRSSLKSITIPDSVKSIGDYAFFDCRSLTSITIPEGVTSIGDHAFAGCENLTNITIPEGVTSIGNKVFSGCKSLTSITIPEGVTSIGRMAFRSCSSLTSITIPEGVTSIGDRAFSNCESLTSITIPDSVTSIGDYAFYWCESLTSITIPEGVTSIGESAFEDCENLTNITIPSSITSINKRAFEGCDSLTSVTIPESVMSIGEEAFYICSSLTSVTIPDSVTSIGDKAFSACYKLTSIAIPDSVTSIGNEAFASCYSLTSITIPNKLNIIGESAFKSCKKLCDQNGFIIFNDILYGYCGKTNNIVIPSGVTGIADGAFSDNYGEAIKVTISDGLTNAGGKAFSGPKRITLQTPKGFFTSGKNLGSGFIPFLTDAAKAYASVIMYCTEKEWKKGLDKYKKDKKRHFDPNAIAAAMARLMAENSNGANTKKIADFVVKNIDFLESKTVKDIVQALGADEKASKSLLKDPAVKTKLSSTEDEASLHPVEALVKKNWQIYDLSDKLLKIIKEGVPYADGSGISSRNALVLIIAAYAVQKGDAARYIGAYKTGYPKVSILPKIDEIAAGLDTEALRQSLEKISKDIDDGGVLIAFGRYASPSQVDALIRNMKLWEDWRFYGQKGRANIILSRGGLMLSDTEAAVKAIDRAGGLSYYAEIRGTDADSIRGSVMADLGFDSNGQIELDLGGNTAVVTLGSDLKISIFDKNANKEVKTLPKKNADSALYSAAQSKLTGLKKRMRDLASLYRPKLFSAYLNKETHQSDKWSSLYMAKPALNAIARLLVWQQDDISFVPTGTDKLIRSDGSEYALTASPVFLAHPMELTPEEVKAWQDYFADRGLKQLFEQIWEPVIDMENVKEDRYKGCQIPYYRFLHQEKHGITVDDQELHDEIEISFKDCHSDIERLVWRRHEIEMNDPFEIKSFSTRSGSRFANHITAYLDRAAVYEMIKNDNVSVVNILNEFTVAQITEFIKAASENNSINVSAALLEYKNANYADLDPFAEFTLDD